MVIIISLLTVVSTFLGGLFALRFKDKLHLILGFSAGALLGVAFFDLLPEALALGGTVYSSTTITSVVALGFLLYMGIDRLVTLHAHGEETPQIDAERAKLGAASLSFHSFLDGLAIGLAFQVGTAVGAIVATAVLVHDFSDGINTVNLVLRNRGSAKSAFRWLIVDAAAPVLGVCSTLFFTLPEAVLGIILSIFCGFFLYIGASDLLPESYHGHPTQWTTFMTLVGMATLFIAVRIAGL
jgi:ZIP family zinc transporter